MFNSPHFFFQFSLFSDQLQSVSLLSSPWQLEHRQLRRLGRLTNGMT
jgi:hypothetical protein